MIGYQRREYGNKTGAEGGDKQESSGSLSMISGGPARSGASSGSTGSSRSYPKGSSLSLSPVDPMTNAKSTYGVGGV